MGRHRELLPEAEALIGTGDRRFRQFAVFASASLGSTEAMEAAVPALRSRRSGEREASAAAVGFGKSEEMRNALLALRDDPEPGVQIAAWASLSRYGHPQARTKLTEAILSGDDRRAPLAAGALKRGQSETVVAVAREVVDSGKVHPLVLGRVIEAVGWSRNIPAKDVLEMGLAPEQDQHVRLQSLWAVGWRGRAEEKQLAVDHFEDPELPLRAMASWAYLYAKRGGAPPDTGLVAD